MGSKLNFISYRYVNYLMHDLDAVLIRLTLSAGERLLG
jgi:hypothetical protein